MWGGGCEQLVPERVVENQRDVDRQDKYQDLGATGFEQTRSCLFTDLY
jgi:hypothetical protein